MSQDLGLDVGSTKYASRGRRGERKFPWPDEAKAAALRGGLLDVSDHGLRPPLRRG